jgi:hypothetical protein
MSKQLVLMYAPTWRIRDGLLELHRATTDLWTTEFSPTNPDHMVIRCSAIEAASFTDPQPRQKAVPTVLIEMLSTNVCVSFVVYASCGTRNDEDTWRQAQAARPAAREFYAQLVREMKRDGD